MRVYISVDAEGVTGITKISQVIPSKPEYAFCRRMMAGDINAAIRGAFNAGATEVVVNDSHNYGDNLIIEDLDERAKLLSGPNKPHIMMEGIDKGFDAVLFVGYHSRKGEKGIIPHTYIYYIPEVTINKKPVAEYEINGLLAGYYNVPVIYVSGDNEFVKDAKENIPGVQGTITKEAISNNTALCYHPNATHKQIEKDVQTALENLKENKIKKMTLPSEKIELEILFANSGEAAIAAKLAGFKMISPTRIKFESDDYLDIFNNFISAIEFATTFKEME